MEYMSTKKTFLIIGIILLVAAALPTTAYLFKKGYFDVRNRASDEQDQTDTDTTTDVDLYGSGADGAVTISSDTNINTDHKITSRNASCADAVNYSVTALTANNATLSTEMTTGCLVAGDEVILINLAGTQDSVVNVGNYEVLEVDSASGTSVTFKTSKTKYYGTGSSDDENLGVETTNQRVMLQRVPQYTDVTIATGASFHPSDWDGSKGGVMFFKASGTVTVEGSITAEGAGYTGGSQSNIQYRQARAGHGAFFTDIADGAGGEGVNTIKGGAGTFSGGGGGGKKVNTGGTSGAGGAGSTLPGAMGGGGGGSTYRTNSDRPGWGGGGGGGGHATAGEGGYGCTYGEDGSATSSGAGSKGANCSGNRGGGGGGGATFGAPTLTKLTIGGGGGGGGFGRHNKTDDLQCKGGAGGRGGGIIFVVANKLNISGAISAKGDSGRNSQSKSGKTCIYGGGGGGGAAGSIKIVGGTLSLGESLVSASGGTGGTSGTEGGAGGDGHIRIEYYDSLSGTTTPSASSVELTGGTTDDDGDSGDDGDAGTGGEDLGACSYADINEDGSVSMTDYALFVEDYMDYRDNDEYNERSDFNDDEAVTMSDYSLFVNCYLENN